MPTVGRGWLDTFLTALRHHEAAVRLREAAMEGHLGAWTRALTDVVVSTFPTMGWTGAAKGHKSTILPVPREEYLALDVVAFVDSGDRRWRFPAAVFELENSRDDDVVAYALWKTLCVRAGLRVVFCYRRDFVAGVELVERLHAGIVREMGVSERLALGGETVLVVGSRDAHNTFPNGFFKTWSLDANIGQFQNI
jgi:hypothetical protein